MICNYRVTLKGIKGFFRLYNVNPVNTLYTFHKQLRSDLEFPQDLPILFKAFDKDENVIARYALIDLGFGTVDSVTIEKTIKDGAVAFEYFYDTVAKKSVIITLEGETKGAVAMPVITESKGPLPIEFENGYVAFEDLPAEKRHLPGEHCNCGKDDCDCDDDEDFDDEDVNDEEDDDETEEIYDAEE